MVLFYILQCCFDLMPTSQGRNYTYGRTGTPSSGRWLRLGFLLVYNGGLISIFAGAGSTRPNVDPRGQPKQFNVRALLHGCLFHHI